MALMIEEAMIKYEDNNQFYLGIIYLVMTIMWVYQHIFFAIILIIYIAIICDSYEEFFGKSVVH